MAQKIETGIRPTNHETKERTNKVRYRTLLYTPYFGIVDIIQFFQYNIIIKWFKECFSKVLKVEKISSNLQSNIHFVPRLFGKIVYEI